MSAFYYPAPHQSIAIFNPACRSAVYPPLRLAGEDPGMFTRHLCGGPLSGTQSLRGGRSPFCHFDRGRHHPYCHFDRGRKAERRNLPYHFPSASAGWGHNPTVFLSLPNLSAAVYPLHVIPIALNTYAFERAGRHCEACRLGRGNL